MSQANIDAGTYLTKTTTIGSGVPDNWHQKRFLETFVPELRVMQFMRRFDLPEGNGTKVTMHRGRPLSLITTALTQGINPDPELVYDDEISVSLADYGNWIAITTWLYQAHLNGDIPSDLVQTNERLASQAGRSLEMILKKEIVANGIFPVRADLDATKTYSGTLTAVTSTTVMSCTGLESNTNYGDTDDDLNQSWVVFTTGACKGTTRPISDYDADGGATGTAAAGKFTCAAALDMTPSVGDAFTVVSADALTTGDVLSYTNINKALENLMNHNAGPWAGGWFKALFSPTQMAGLKTDTEWKAVQEYKDRTRGIEDGYVKEFCGFQHFIMNEVFRFPITTIGTSGSSYGPGAAGANYSASGHVECALYFGQDAFGGTTFRKKSGELRNPRIIIKGPNQYDKVDFLGMWAGAGWHVPFAAKALWSLHNNGILTYV